MHVDNTSPGFTTARLRRLIEMERSHFWFVGRRELIDRLLGKYARTSGRQLADIGSGGGYFAQTLSARGYCVTAIDFLPEGLMRLATGTPSVRAVQSSAERLGLRGGAYDCALALDMLEHVEDVEAAGELFRILRPGGVLIATVPAFDWLWSYRDTAAGHRRRYTRRLLVDLLNRTGFKVEQTGYYGFFLLPLTIASRLAGRMTKATRDMEDLPPQILNRFFRFINSAEARLSARVPWPCGSSLFAVARRPE